MKFIEKTFKKQQKTNKQTKKIIEKQSRNN